VRKRPVVVGFGLVLGLLLAGYILMKSLMEMLEVSEFDWSSDLEED